MNMIRQLHEKYPSVFSNEVVNRLNAECGPGWSHLLETLCGLVHHRNLASQERPAHIVKVKEKLGGIRILIQAGSPEIGAWTEFALQHSMRVCEVCGAPGRLMYEDGWQRTRCEAHRLVSIADLNRVSEL